MMVKFKQDMKLENEKIKHRRYCKKCGHAISFYAFEPERKLCDYCGVFNYKNDLVEFKTLLNKKKRGINENE